MIIGNQFKGDRFAGSKCYRKLIQLSCYKAAIILYAARPDCILYILDDNILLMNNKLNIFFGPKTHLKYNTFLHKKKPFGLTNPMESNSLFIFRQLGLIDLVTHYLYSHETC